MIRLLLLVRGNKRPVRTQTHIHRERERLLFILLRLNFEVKLSQTS